MFHIIPCGNWIIKVGTDSYSSDASPKTIMELGLSDENLDLNLEPGASFEPKNGS